MSYVPPLALKPETYESQESPRVTLDVSSFEEWEERAEAFYQTQFGYLSRHQRSLYDMLGQTVFMETFFSHNIFVDPVVRVIAADFTIREDSETMALAARHGAEWMEGYYMDEGLGWPVFHGDDGCRRCFEFLTEWRARGG